MMVRVRNSERKDFVRCRQKWWWAYVEHLRSRQNKPALEFGDIIHQALAEWYAPGRKRNGKLSDHFMSIWKENEPDIRIVWDEDQEQVDAFDLGVEMCDNYEEEYGDDSQFEIIAPEQPFQVELYDSETEEYLCQYVGTMDAVCRDNMTGKLGLMEHKTTASLPPRQWLPMDEQASTYWTFGPEWLWDNGILKPNEDMDFILYNFLKKKRKDTREQNKDGLYLNQNGSVSKVQPGPLFHREIVYRNEAMRQAMWRRTEEQVWEMQLVREGTLAVYKNPTSDCKWDCQFRDMCELHERGADWESFRDGTMTDWSPYEIHLKIPTELTR